MGISGKWHGATHDMTTDRVYATTLCSLMLTVYYRYLPGSETVIKSRIAKGAKDREIESPDLLD